VCEVIVCEVIVSRLPRIIVCEGCCVCEVIVCERWYVTKLCVKFVCVCEVIVCEVIVCERWYVTKL